MAVRGLAVLAAALLPRLSLGGYSVWPIALGNWSYATEWVLLQILTAIIRQNMTIFFFCKVKLSTILTTRSNWSSLPGNEACNMSSQSPIDLNTTSATHATAANHARLFVHGHGVPTMSELANNGHSAQLDVKETDNFHFGFSYMDRNYSLVQLHSHWGRSGTMVSPTFHPP